jgi:hypothetical protein
MTVMVSPTPMVGVAEAAADEGSAWDVQWNLGQRTRQAGDVDGGREAVRKYRCADAARRQLHRALSTGLRRACRGLDQRGRPTTATAQRGSKVVRASRVRRLRWQPRCWRRGGGGGGWAGVAPCHSTWRRPAYRARSPGACKPPCAAAAPRTCRMCEWTSAVIERGLDASPCSAEAAPACRHAGRLLPEYRCSAHVCPGSPASAPRRHRLWRCGRVAVRRCGGARTASSPRSPSFAALRGAGCRYNATSPAAACDLHQAHAFVGCPRCAFCHRPSFYPCFSAAATACMLAWLRVRVSTSTTSDAQSERSSERVPRHIRKPVPQ